MTLPSKMRTVRILRQIQALARIAATAATRCCCSSQVLLLVVFSLFAGACDQNGPPRQTVHVAVATNFLGPLRSLVTDFEADSNYVVTVSAGSTAALYAQIIHGAPYDVFLAADREHPARLIDAQRAQDRFVYARGQLVLWAADQRLRSADGRAEIVSGQYLRLAIANPRLAPYGAAARQTLQNLGMWDTLQDKLVFGENVGQAYAMVATGNVDLGLVALSLITTAQSGDGSYWQVAPDLYAPIAQEAVLLQRAVDNPAAQAFMEFLQRPATQQKVAALGYAADK